MKKLPWNPDGVASFARIRASISQKAAIGAALGVIMASLPTTARAGDLLRGGHMSASSGGAARQSAGGQSQAITGQLGTPAADLLARTTQALASVQAMQVAARNAAAATASGGGLNPNNPGQLLPSVPNGLGIGALAIDPNIAIDKSLGPVRACPRRQFRVAKRR